MSGDAAADTLGLIREFVEATRAVSTLSELRLSLAEAVSSVGIDFFLMAHHVDFSRPAPGSVQISNYPAEFVALQRQNRGWRHDPALLACEKTTAGFFWSDVEKIIPLAGFQKKRFEEVSKYGIGDGFVVPNHIPGEHSGSVHFATATGVAFPRHLSSSLQSLATYGFEAARRLARPDGATLVRCPPMTSRQLDCLLLVARGKSDTDIAQLLGISVWTVNEHLEAAKRRYCVRTRQQLIIQALYHSQISFAEVLH